MVLVVCQGLRSQAQAVFGGHGVSDTDFFQYGNTFFFLRVSFVQTSSQNISNSSKLSCAVMSRTPGTTVVSYTTKAFGMLYGYDGRMDASYPRVLYGPTGYNNRTHAAGCDNNRTPLDRSLARPPHDTSCCRQIRSVAGADYEADGITPPGGLRPSSR